MPDKTKADAWLGRHEGLYRYFKAHNLPSISPGQGMTLLRVMEGLKEELDTEQNETIREFLLAYIEALHFVTDISAIQQKAVIDRLGELIGATDEGAKADAGQT